MKVNWKKPNSWTSIIISVLAFGGTIWGNISVQNSNKIAENSNRIANEANLKVDEYFIIEKRPYLITSIEKNKEHKFLELIGDKLHFAYSLTITNEGGIAAKETLIKTYFIDPEEQTIQFISVIENSDLGKLLPTKKYTISAIGDHAAGAETKNIFNYFKKTGKYRLRIEISYRSDVNESKPYITARDYEFSGSDVYVLGGIVQ